MKRVTNGGYSKVKSEAPDMENSVVVEGARESEAPKGATRTAPSAKKSASTAKRSTAKSGAAKKSPVSAKPKATASEEAAPRSGFCPIGSEMPDFLL